MTVFEPGDAVVWEHHKGDRPGEYVGKFTEQDGGVYVIVRETITHLVRPEKLRKLRRARP